MPAQRGTPLPIPGRLNIGLAFLSAAVAAALLWLVSHTDHLSLKLAGALAFSYANNTVFSLLHESVRCLSHFPEDQHRLWPRARSVLSHLVHAPTFLSPRTPPPKPLGGGAIPLHPRRRDRLPQARPVVRHPDGPLLASAAPLLPRLPGRSRSIHVADVSRERGGLEPAVRNRRNDRARRAASARRGAPGNSLQCALADSALPGSASDMGRLGPLLCRLRGQLELSSVLRPRLVAAGCRGGGVEPSGESPGALALSQLPPPPRAPRESEGAVDSLASPRRPPRAAALVPLDLPQYVAGPATVAWRSGVKVTWRHLSYAALLTILVNVLFVVVYGGADYITGLRSQIG